MKKNTKFTLTLTTALLVIASIVSSCKKENDPHKPPTVTFKTTAGYTFANDTVSMNDTILVGIIADKVEDPLKTLNVSYAYDGAASTTSKDNFTIATVDQVHYEKDYTIVTRNVTGSEKWIFTVTDRDGNITSMPLTLTVQ